MNAPFPHHYAVTLAGDADARGTLTAGPRPTLEGGPPPEFGGDDSRWSPEHLLLAAASLCLKATFAAVAAKSQLAWSDWKSAAEGTLDKTPEGLRFTRIALKVSVRSPDAEKAGRMLELAKKHCIVSNSLRQPVEVEATVAS
ncbi:MAG: OsmC family protein [Elusimicrobiota bacterium]|nr:OsmC family protein [Elusimicrobiota bacterium]